MNDDELGRLDAWSSACEMSRSEYIRSLIMGIRPVEFPPLDYREIKDELRKIGVNMNQLATKAHSLGFIDELEYRRNVQRVLNIVAELNLRLGKAGVPFGSN